MIVLAEDTHDAQEPQESALEPQRFARLAGAMGILLLLTAAWIPMLGAVAQSSAKEIRILPRLSVFFCALLLAQLLAGGRWKIWQSTAAATFFGALTLTVLGQLNAVSHAYLPAHAALLFAAQTLALVFAGLALSACIHSGGALLQLLAVAIVGDIWIHAQNVADGARREAVLSLLRMTWPPPQGLLAQAPGGVEILVCGVLAGCAKRLGLPLVSITLGAFAGYCAASFLALPPWPAWSTLSVLLMTSGTLIGCWPDLELRLLDLRRAFITSGILLLMMVLFTVLSAPHGDPDAPPAADPEPFKYRLFT